MEPLINADKERFNAEDAEAQRRAEQSFCYPSSLRISESLRSLRSIFMFDSVDI